MFSSVDMCFMTEERRLLCYVISLTRMCLLIKQSLFSGGKRGDCVGCTITFLLQAVSRGLSLILLCEIKREDVVKLRYASRHWDFLNQ